VRRARRARPRREKPQAAAGFVKAPPYAAALRGGGPSCEGSATEREPMSDEKVLPTPPEWARNALVNDASYRSMHAAALDDPEAFWGHHGQRLDWIRPYTKVKDVSYNKEDFHIRWYEDGVLNVSANCIDRHLAERGDSAAIIWEGDDPKDSKTITYRQLHEE